MNRSQLLKPKTLTGRVALLLFSILLGTLLVITASGNEHARDNHKPWVEAVGWVGAACFYGLVGIGLVAVRRWARARRLHHGVN